MFLNTTVSMGKPKEAIDSYPTNLTQEISWEK